MTTVSQACPKCGREIPAAMFMSLCPSCLGDAISAVAPDTTEIPVFAAETAPDRALPVPLASMDGEPFGRYILRPLKQGGMGAVFTAWDTLGGRFVALKKLGSRLPADSSSAQRFSGEVKLVTQLEHPYVVPVYEVNQHEGQLYFTMKLMPGSLADCVDEFRNDPQAVAELVARIANAVHYVHQRGLLHCDLKPANILLDADEKPYVADFGIAQRLEPAACRVRSSRMGTVSFMAPEQVDECAGLPTQAADVYSLGVVLYQLITGGCLPFPGRTPAEVLEKIRNRPPVDPLSIPGEGDVDRDLAAISLRCLEKSPDARYASAKELETELRRYLGGEGYQGRSQRIWRWCLKYRAVLSLALSVVLFATTLAIVSLSIVRSEDEAQRREIQHSLEVRAGLGARSVLLHFMELARFVREVAERPALARALEGREHTPKLREHAVRDICNAAQREYGELGTAVQRREGEPFRFWSAYDARGVAVAHTEVTNAFMGEDFSGRDYFIGAKLLGEKGLHQTHLSSVFIGTSTREFEFALSAPIFGADGRWLGALVASVLTTGELNSAPLDDQRHSAVLVGPEDPTSGRLVPPIVFPSSPVPLRYRVFRHPKLARGTSLLFEHPQVRAMALNQERDERVTNWQLPLTGARRGRALKGYEDPFGTAQVPWASGRLAAFAPIGRTGYAVIAQFDDEDALGREKHFSRRLLEAGAFAAVLGTLLGTLPALIQFARLKRCAHEHSIASRTRLERRRRASGLKVPA